MRIDDDLKLTFRDVLIRPKRSTLKSRSDVSLSRVFRFRHTDNEWEGVPVVAANMDTTGTFEIAEAFKKNKFYNFRFFLNLHLWCFQLVVFPFHHILILALLL